MEIGAENKKKVLLAVVLALGAVVSVGRFLFSSSESAPVAAAPSAQVTPAPAANKPARAATSGKRSTQVQPSLDPTLRYDWLKTSEDMKYEGKGRNIFRAEAEPQPVPLGNGTTDHVVQAPPPQPGPLIPPPINLKFYGFATSHGESKKVFLSEGEDIFIAGEGDIIDRRYKILHISPMSVEVEDVLNNNRQQIPLTQG